jgi:hypothetical protein
LLRSNGIKSIINLYQHSSFVFDCLADNVLAFCEELLGDDVGLFEQKLNLWKLEKMVVASVDLSSFLLSGHLHLDCFGLFFLLGDAVCW